MDLNERFIVSSVLQELHSDIGKKLFDFRNGDSDIYEVYKATNGMRLFIERMVESDHIPKLEKDNKG